MAQALSDEILTMVKSLITRISDFKEGSQQFNATLEHFTTELKKSDSMYFSSKKDIDCNISSMCEKFCFHGCFKQAEALEEAYKAYISPDLPKPVLVNRLNVVKMLLCLSEKPVSKFFEHPEMYLPPEKEIEEDIDWGAYLKEDIPIWCPNFDETTDESDLENVDNSYVEKTLKSESVRIPTTIEKDSSDVRVDFQARREELLSAVQHGWFDNEKFYMKPKSDWRETNIATLYEDFKQKEIRYLVGQKNPSVISEYCVIREVMWQLFVKHTSVVFEIVQNDIKPRKNITISSVRSGAFERYMNEFVGYIELLEYFRDFMKYVGVLNEDVPTTYRSYSQGIYDITSLVYKKLCDMESEIRKQETTYTLLMLADDLHELFKPIKLLKKIHDEVMLDCDSNTFLVCSTHLINKLHASLPYCVNKQEQDIRLTLFLNSIYHYLYLLDHWLLSDMFRDYTNEFLIVRDENCELQEMHYVLHEDVENTCRKNSFLKIFCEKVLRIGRNVHFLTSLKKYNILVNNTESIRDEFYRKTIEELCKFYDLNPEEYLETDEKDVYEDPILKFQNANCKFVNSHKENCDANIESTDVTSNGFLMLAFQDYIKQPDDEIVKKKPDSLYEKVSKITKNLFPKSNFFERILNSILEERFTVSGLVVKNILIEKYSLEKHFQFLRHVYLFFDDFIFPFYRRFFVKVNSSNKNWGNHTSLTSHFQDILLDLYPDFSEKCSVVIKENWTEISDPLAACSFVNIRYKINWPLNIIIKDNQMVTYKIAFEFILKLKWALYVVSHLSFSDLDLERNANKVAKSRAKRLKVLRFSVLNVLITVQHFLLGYAFKKSLMRFELDFEKSHDINSLIESHAVFISSIQAAVEDVRMQKNSFEELLICCNQLKLMWNNARLASDERLNDCFAKYNSFYSDISPVVFPVSIFDS